MSQWDFYDSLRKVYTLCNLYEGYYVTQKPHQTRRINIRSLTVCLARYIYLDSHNTWVPSYFKYDQRTKETHFGMNQQKTKTLRKNRNRIFFATKRTNKQTLTPIFLPFG